MLFFLLIASILTFAQSLDKNDFDSISEQSEDDLFLENVLPESKQDKISYPNIFLSNTNDKNDDYYDDLLMDESEEDGSELRFSKRSSTDQKLRQLKDALSKLLKENTVDKREVSKIGKSKSTKPNFKKRRNTKKNKEAKWDQWNSWSACSVTCGKGRHIRWRHCKEMCDGVEIEMQEKACQLPACPLKLFGLIKL